MTRGNVNLSPQCRQLIIVYCMCGLILTPKHITQITVRYQYTQMRPVRGTAFSAPGSAGSEKIVAPSGRLC